MSSSTTKFKAEPLDLSKWRNVPFTLMVVGAVLSGIGALVNVNEFLYSWLLSFMFFLSLGLGALFLVLMHHLFDAGWSGPIRQFYEHLSTLFYKVLPCLFIPIVLWAKAIYPWMHEAHPELDHALHAKQPLFSMSGFYLVALFCFVIWWFLASRLR